MKVSRVLAVVAGLVCLALVAFVVYGLRTDCAHTAGYVDCSAPDSNP
jgi:hypothetical protein